MTLNYQQVWETMNDLEMVTSKICSAREILDCAIDAHQEYKHEKVEHLLNAVDEYLQYYLEEFDRKFKLAWKETVSEIHQIHVDLENQITDDKSESYYDYTRNDPNRKNPFDKVKKWILPVEVDGLSGECFVQFPDDLLEAANLKESDQIEWIEQDDDSYLMKKVEKKTLTHDEATKAGWEMTDDGVWLPPQDC